MMSFGLRLARALTLACALGAACAAAAAPAKSDAKAAAKSEAKGAAKSSDSSSPASLLPGTNSKAPISIEADKLVYFDKEQKAVYTGNVVVIQGDTKMTCSGMTIFMEKGPDASQPAASQPAAAKAADAGPAAGPGGSSSRVRHLDATGPVTVLSKTQVATGDTASYDKAQNKVWLVGNVTLSDGGNVTKGDKLTYDLTTGQATVDTGAAANRVRGLFIPGSGSGDSDNTKAQK
jgi:lipopolysaccharide export system protein LptA